MITSFRPLNGSTYMLDLNNRAVSLDNLAGTSHAVAMGRRFISSHCLLTDQHYKKKMAHVISKYLPA